MPNIVRSSKNSEHMYLVFYLFILFYFTTFIVFHSITITVSQLIILGIFLPPGRVKLINQLYKWDIKQRLYSFS